MHPDVTQIRWSQRIFISLKDYTMSLFTLQLFESYIVTSYLPAKKQFQIFHLAFVAMFIFDSQKHLQLSGKKSKRMEFSG